jgi:glycosyltransferase involved in cell wall biosynthesis
MSRSDRRTFTVFTPTYNRASTLPRTRESLEAQTFRDFEWLIVDDGSQDGTRELVEGWRTSSPIDVRYIYQENAGKHVAFNRGVREARGDLFLALDSDDECVPNALERFLYHWESIPSTERAGFSAVTALCQDDGGRIVGEPFPRDPYDSDPLSIYFAGTGKGEKWGFHRTDVLRRYPFPEPAGVKFVSEAVVWFAIGRHYKTRYVNEPLRVYHAVTGPRLSLLNETTALGRLLFHREVVTKYIDYLPRSPFLVMKSGINYSRYALDCGIGPAKQVRDLDPLSSKLLVSALMLPGAVAFVRDVLSARRSSASS